LDAATSQESDGCVFCRIVNHDVPATVVYEDARVLAFLDVAPATDGHTLVVPKNHAQDLLSVTPEDLAAVATASQAVARLLDDRLRPDGFTVFQANGRAGWQDVFHLHFHVVPRWQGDPLRLPWKSEPASRQHIATIAARLALPPTA
jgi:histidine triad (HIT) family protein